MPEFDLEVPSESQPCQRIDLPSSSDIKQTISNDSLKRNDSGDNDPDELKENDEVQRMPSDELERQANLLEQAVRQKMASPASQQTTKRNLLVETVMGDKDKKDDKGHGKKKGAFAGVFVPTCENMWGVLIFLRFYFVVGQAGILEALLAVCISFCAAFCTTSSMSAIVSSGGIVSKGGPYYMISRALGPVVGASVGIMYWLAITLLSVLEVLGAVEALLMAVPSLEFPGCKQAFGTVFMAILVLSVYVGMSFVTKLGIFFVFIVFYTMGSYYIGIATAPMTAEAIANPWVTGLSMDTFSKNWGSHYDKSTSFGVVLSVFFPCFTGILSGANRADILRDPPKNIKDGTFAAIIFSFFMYSSFFILWGSVADYRYLQGQEYHPDGHELDGNHAHRRLAGAGGGEHLVTEIVWNPFPHSAQIGIIISSLSQALQCLIVAPRLLQAIARDQILTVLDRIAPLSSKGEPARALGATYIFAGMLVLIGEVNQVAPLLSMCFLVAYAFMNFSCFTLTWVRAPGFRPSGMGKRRWRIWYMGFGFLGTVVCLSIMFIISPYWALGVLFVASLLYLYINWRLEQHEWGSAMDGIRFQLALSSLIQLEQGVQHAVNWRPQILILYRIHLTEELQGIKHHEILRFYSHLRKGNGFAVVACVLESKVKDEHVMHKAHIEKQVIKSIMKEEGIQGFSEVVVAPTWAEGADYIIQLTGIGGLVPNTVLVDWPSNWKKYKKKAADFVSVVKTALSAEKAVMAIKGLSEIPEGPVVGTIDVWWMIHDGGFMILLSWLLLQHKIWRQCHIRIFTITEGVSEERAKNAAKLLTHTLRQRRLFDVDVEVIIADDEMIEPYTYDWTLRVDQRHKFVEQLHGGHTRKGGIDAIPLEIDDLFKMESDEAGSVSSRGPEVIPAQEGQEGHVAVSDLRAKTVGQELSEADHVKRSHQIGVHGDSSRKPSKSHSFDKLRADSAASSSNGDQERTRALAAAAVLDLEEPELPHLDRPHLADETAEWDKVGSFQKLNETIQSRSKRAQLVVMNLPDIWSTEEAEVNKFMTYCDTMTAGLDRVLFVHSTGHEVFEIG